MIIENILQMLGETEMISSNRQDCAPDVNIQCAKVVIPEKFKADVEALEHYAELPLQSGLCITMTLAELLTICPRERRRLDAYYSLVHFLQGEMNVTLNINSQKRKSYETAISKRI